MKFILNEKLVCPLCHNQLFLDKEKKYYICHNEKLMYPISDGIAVLLKERAILLPQEEEV